MSEKYPALDTELVGDETLGGETDFLKREAEILGDEFKTEHDDEILHENELVEETEDNLGETESHNIETSEEPIIPTTTNEISQESKDIIANWKETRNKEIKERDEKDEREKTELQDEAIKYIDDFYESYNKKKQQQIDVAKKESEKFLEDRDKFFNQDNTTWDRVLQLINQEDADIVSGRDRSKFKEILLRLKGKAGVPGA